uniref:Boule 1 RNA-binding protein n=1 Tax=Schmidtea mediterranea TaxID=79327 RepID=A0A172RVQ0_SCHMD|nr:boule 1 RNA-binding protein [Schmidtea mediterranea]
MKSINISMIHRSTDSQLTPKVDTLAQEFQVSLAAVNQATMTAAANPKIGTLIPNRIFVGGITSNTTEEELKIFFSSYGPIKDVKIINDRTGLSKGSYGFVTFENQETAEKIIKNEAETLIFKERKLNIGHAVRKQKFLEQFYIMDPCLMLYKMV